VLGLSIMSMDFGNIPVTTTNMPEGGLGNFKVSMLNIGASYAKGFTDHIFGGMNLKVIDEAIPNAKSAGVALDAGIQYVAGKMTMLSLEFIEKCRAQNAIYRRWPCFPYRDK